MKQLDCLGFYSLWVTAVVQAWGTLIQKPELSLQLALQHVAITPHPTPPLQGKQRSLGRQGGVDSCSSPGDNEKVKVFIAQSCLTDWDPMDCGPPGSTVHGILQATIQEWVAISSSRDSSSPKYWTPVSHIAGRSFTVWATRAAQENMIQPLIKEARFVGRRRDLRNMYTEVALETF